jgi:hypothetical protein
MKLRSVLMMVFSAALPPSSARTESYVQKAYPGTARARPWA